MSRRIIAASAVGATLVAGVVTASAETAPLPDPPRANCPKRLVDNPGDAVFPPGTSTKADGLDLTGVNFRLTADQLQIFLAITDVKAPGAMPLTDGAYQYNVSAKFGDKNVTFKLFQRNTQAPWTSAQNLPANADRGDMGSDTSPGDALTGYTATAHADKDFVVFTAPRPILEQKLGEPLDDGDKFESITVSLKHYINQTNRELDKLDVAAASATFVVGDDYCFGLPPAIVSDLVTAPVQYGDAVTLSAKLSDEAGAAVAGKKIEFTVAGDAPVVATTGADGIAKATYVPKAATGTRAVVARFAGDDVHGPSKVTGSIAISPEVTVFNALQVAKPSATSRVVTATLLDNDKRAVTAQKVDWYVNGRKVASVTTDSRGRSVYRGAKAGQTVQAKYAGLAGKYKAATSRSAKV